MLCFGGGVLLGTVLLHMGGEVTNHSTAAGHVTQSSPLIGPGAGDHQGGGGDGRVREGGAAGGLPAGGPHRGAR